jgi:hypothetical protein
MSSIDETADLDKAVAAARQLLLALFTAADVVLFRPVETWTENDKKHSRVIYKSTLHRLIDPENVDSILKSQIAVGAKEQANLFFGVCPRAGFKGQYDLACQIRTVRVLWADIDHVSPDEALARCKAAGLTAR